jgi:transposase
MPNVEILAMMSNVFDFIPCDLVEDFYGIRISPATIKRVEKECFQNL